MNPEYDVIIVGSGPAGVSAAFPLLEHGLKVLMLDGGATPDKKLLTDNFLDMRSSDSEQWRWMIGEDFHALKMQDAISPKLRVPNLSYVFDAFAAENKIQSEKFIAIGSLASGGLSNAWGAGVARFNTKDLSQFPVPMEDWDKHYNSVARRIGISGKSDDDLADYFLVDTSAQPATPLDDINTDFLSKYTSNKNYFKKSNFKLGRSRVAVLTNDMGERKACSLSGNCLWGCANRSIYSASEDLQILQKNKNFRLVSGAIVENFISGENGWVVFSQDITNKKHYKFTASKVILAAGTLATTRLALKHLGIKTPTTLLSSPTAAFLVWNYKRFGAVRKSGFGLGQLSYSINIADNISAFGSTFSTNGIPIAEFAKQVPLSRSVAIDVLAALLSSCTVGNIFLPGNLTHATATLLGNDVLQISGAYSEKVPELMRQISTQVRKAFWKMGGVVLPGSFTVGKPGSDIHYAGSLPMSATPVLGQTSSEGELKGTEGLYIVDGACLPILPEKSHTLTIMANAERIATAIALAHEAIH
jgi:choline dehydrogenase-like flavoprotein